jgi:hypothetical protein
MTTISRECARARHITELIGEQLDTALVAPISAGEHDLAGLASRCGTNPEGLTDYIARMTREAGQ